MPEVERTNYKCS